MEQDKLQQTLDKFQEKIQGTLDKIQESQSNTEKKMIKFEAVQESNTKDISDLKDNQKRITDTVVTLKTVDAVQEALKTAANFNKQTLTRPMLVGIVVGVVTFIAVMGICIFIVLANTKAQEQVNRNVQTMIDTVKEIKGVNQ